MSIPRVTTIVMVPKGAEYNAVQRGLRSARNEPLKANGVELISLPMGPDPVYRFLMKWSEQLANEQMIGETHDSKEIQVILMGLCGSLSPQIQVGEVVVYERCIQGGLKSDLETKSVSGQMENVLECDAALSHTVRHAQNNSVISVTGLMCDRMVAQAADKSRLAQQYPAQVVDMEGYAVLECLRSLRCRISMVRVVSDDATHDVPDLSCAFDADGNLNPLALSWKFLTAPMSSIRLIRGSLTALKQLEEVAGNLAILVAKSDPL